MAPPPHRADGECAAPPPAWPASVGVTLTVFLIADLGGMQKARPADRFPVNALTEGEFAFPFTDKETVDYGLMCGLGAMMLLCLFALEVLIAWASPQKHADASSNAPRGQTWVRLLLLPTWCFACGVDATLLTLVVTSTLKNYVGEPRPDYVARCAYANGLPAHAGVAQCDTPAALASSEVMTDGRRSFPSGHASTAAVFGVYLAGYAALRLGDHRVRRIALHESAPWPLAVAVAVVLDLLPLLPLFAAFFVAASRVADFRHSPGDVSFGFLIGSAFAVHGLTRFRHALARFSPAPPPHATDDEGRALFVHEYRQQEGRKRVQQEVGKL